MFCMVKVRLCQWLIKQHDVTVYGGWRYTKLTDRGDMNGQVHFPTTYLLGNESMVPVRWNA